MPIRVQCSCGATYTVKERLSGKKFKCQKCGNALRAEAGEAKAEAKGDRQEDDDFLGALDDAVSGETDFEEESQTSDDELIFEPLVVRPAKKSGSKKAKQAGTKKAKGQDSRKEAEQPGGPREWGPVACYAAGSAILFIPPALIAGLIGGGEAVGVVFGITLALPWLLLGSYFASRSMMESMKQMGEGAGCMLALVYGPAILIIIPVMTLWGKACGVLAEWFLKLYALILSPLGITLKGDLKSALEFETVTASSRSEEEEEEEGEEDFTGRYFTHCSECRAKVETTPDRENFYQTCTHCEKTFRVDKVRRG